LKISRFLRVLIILNIQKNVTMSDTGRRGHKLKIYKPQVHFDSRKYFFSLRVIEEWNSLLVVLINCNTVESFKKRIDCYFRNWGYT